MLLKNYIRDNFNDGSRFSINERYIDINGELMHEETIFLGDFNNFKEELKGKTEHAEELRYYVFNTFNDFSVEPDFMLKKNIIIKTILITERS